MQLRKENQDAFTKRHGIKLGFMSAFVKASAYALTLQPTVNAVIEGQEIIYRDYVDISVAVATPKVSPDRGPDPSCSTFGICTLNIVPCGVIHRKGFRSVRLGRKCAVYSSEGLSALKFVSRYFKNVCFGYRTFGKLLNVLLSMQFLPPVPAPAFMIECISNCFFSV